SSISFKKIYYWHITLLGKILESFLTNFIPFNEIKQEKEKGFFETEKKEPTGIAGGSSPAAIKAYHTSGAFQRMYGPPLATYFLLPVNGSSKFSVN
ncbi:MAG: hypothetical protein MR853_07395, partial [Selenomonadales bacterium]|nr:hypothetical protein [Selenomonadales bacterium]